MSEIEWNASRETASKLVYIQWAYICALGYLLRALPQVSYDNLWHKWFA